MQTLICPGAGSTVLRVVSLSFKKNARELSVILKRR
jgi:hypothetical protein